LWKVKVKTDDAYKFHFWQFMPSLVHGTYSTKSSTAGIEDFLSRAAATVDLLAASEGQVAGKQADAGLEGLADDLASAADFEYSA
jgi:hypothetical protein